MYNIFLLSVLFVGFSGIIAQTLLIRELLVVCEGNELSVGIILSNWLLFEALGSYYVSKRIKEQKLYYYIILQIFFIVSFTISLYLTRIIRNILNIDFGVSLGIQKIFIISSIVLFLPSLFHGACYTLSADILAVANPPFYNNKENTVVKPISYAYVYEILGTTLGGIVFTFLLLRLFSSYEIVFITMLLLSVMIILLSFYDRFNHKTVFVSTIFGLTTIFVFMFNLPQKLEKISMDKFWHKLKVEYTKNSYYGRISVIKQETQVVFYLNSVPVITTPAVDRIFAEEIVHIPMSLFTPEKHKSVLVLTGGAGGMISEIIKYKNVAIDYVETDPELLKTVLNFASKDVVEELKSDKVNLQYTDPVRFVSTTKNNYDIVFIGIKELTDLQTNRMFTVEFFDKLKTKVQQHGIVVFAVPGSIVYLSENLIELNKIIYATVKHMFGYVYVLPGDGYNIFFCCDSSYPSILSAKRIVEGMKLNDIKSEILTQGYLEYRTKPQRIKWYFEKITNKKNYLKNHNLLPSALVSNLKYWSKKEYVAGIGEIIDVLLTKDKLLKVIIFLIVSLGLVCFIIKRNYENIIYYSVSTTGYVTMVLSTLIMLSFQCVYGHIFYLAGLLISFFMLGLLLGCLISVRFFPKLKLLFSEIFVVAMIIIVMIMIKLMFIKSFVNNILYFVFLCLSTFTGIVAGIQIPVFSRELTKCGEQKVISAAGKIFAFDTLGGWLGGIFGGTIIFPVLGIYFTVGMLLYLKLLSIINLLTKYEK